MSVDSGRLATSGNSRNNNHMNSDLETWEAKHNESGGSARDHHQTTWTRYLSLSYNMRRGAPSCIKVVHCSYLSAKLETMLLCNISSYLSPVTITVSKPESRISSTKKSPITVDAVQSAAKFFEHLWFFSCLNDNFYHLMLVINSMKPKDYDLTNIYFIKLH